MKINVLGDTVELTVEDFLNGTLEVKEEDVAKKIKVQEIQMKNTQAEFLLKTKKLFEVDKEITDKIEEKAGDKADIPMMNADPAYMLDLGTETSFCYSDASHFRISNIRLSYRFPQAWMEMLHLQSAALSFSCDNVHTFTSSRFIGNDPENVAGWAAPRRFIFGLNVTF